MEDYKNVRLHNPLSNEEEETFNIDENQGEFNIFGIKANPEDIKKEQESKQSAQPVIEAGIASSIEKTPNPFVFEFDINTWNRAKEIVKERYPDIYVDSARYWKLVNDEYANLIQNPSKSLKPNNPKGVEYILSVIEPSLTSRAEVSYLFNCLTGILDKSSFNAKNLYKLYSIVNNLFFAYEEDFVELDEEILDVGQQMKGIISGKNDIVYLTKKLSDVCKSRKEMALSTRKYIKETESDFKNRKEKEANLWSIMETALKDLYNLSFVIKD